MTTPQPEVPAADPSVQAVTPQAAAPQAVAPAQQGVIPTMGGEQQVAVEGTFDNAGQPVESDQQPSVPTDPSEDGFSGLVEVRYTGDQDFEQSGYNFSPGEVKVMNADDAREFLANGSFEAV